ncbi:MAG: hypothetical protein N3E51_04480 [Candidatus Micrarchaeota archaeon]|nr:hypothetical protein [Candidatus Micrarchaeota archaeon]
MREEERQFFHVLAALCSIGLVWLFGRQYSSYILSAALVTGLVLVHLKLSHFRLGFVDLLLDRFERPAVTYGYGALTLAAGILCILTLLESQGEIYASLFILGVGDAASTLVGMRSRRKLPWSKKKTLGGSAAFLLFSLPAAYFGGAAAALAAVAAALAESLETDVDDNLMVALVCVVTFRLFG